MKRFAIALTAVFVVALAATPLVGAASPLDGVWEGRFDPPDGPVEVAFTFDGSCAVMDVPEQGVFWYPVGLFGLKGDKLELKVTIGATPIIVTATLGKDGFTGGFTQGAIKGGFAAKKVAGPLSGATRVPVRKGSLFGRTLLAPVAAAKLPLAVLVQGSGPTNLDGNSRSFEGNNNSGRMLAEGLASSGVASFRYDKRGVGMSASLVATEDDLIFGDYVEDLQAIIAHFRKDPRFSTIVVIGVGEGSLVGMAAARRAKADGFVSIGGTGFPSDETIAKQFIEEEGDPDLVREAMKVITSLKEGRRVEAVNPALYALFRPSIQNYLISWFSYVPAFEISKLECPVLIMRGGRDLQIGMEDFYLLRDACPAAITQIISDMNHILKGVSADTTDNYASYREPLRPLAEGLVDSLVGFVKGIK